DGVVIGTVGEVDPEVIAGFGLAHDRLGFIDLDVVRLAAAPRRSPLVRAVSRFPSSDIDLAFVVSGNVSADQVATVLRRAGGELCESVELFDVYRGDVAPADTDGRRSLAFRLRFCAPDHTLVEGELAELRRECIDAVERALPARLRH
ncbi:MAG: phenylalanine--tRNA ligase subunit beta, partial [Acidimicrobiales bacterium]